MDKVVMVLGKSAPHIYASLAREGEWLNAAVGGVYRLDDPGCTKLEFKSLPEALVYVRDHGGEWIAGEPLPEKPEARKRGSMKHGLWTFRSRPDIPEDEFQFVTNADVGASRSHRNVNLNELLQKYSQRGEIDIRLPARCTQGNILSDDVAIFLRKPEKPEETWARFAMPEYLCANTPHYYRCGRCLDSWFGNPTRPRCPHCGAKLASSQPWIPVRAECPQ